MKVRLHREATDEVTKAAAWYETRRVGLAREFLAEVDRALLVVAGSPAAWPRWPDLPSDLDLDIRRFLLKRFPFVIAYVVRDEITVLSIAHARREPLHWIGRAT